MNSPAGSAHPFQEENVNTSTYHWLLMLGFPESVAAASVQSKASGSGASATDAHPASGTSRHPFGS